MAKDRMKLTSVSRDFERVSIFIQSSQATWKWTPAEPIGTETRILGLTSRMKRSRLSQATWTSLFSKGLGLLGSSRATIASNIGSRVMELDHVIPIKDSIPTIGALLWSYQRSTRSKLRMLLRKGLIKERPKREERNASQCMLTAPDLSGIGHASLAREDAM
jgi:hypothetical protein